MAGYASDYIDDKCVDLATNGNDPFNFIRI